LVAAALQASEHGPCFGGIGGLAERLAVNDDRGIGSEGRLAVAVNGPSFLSGEASDVGVREFAGEKGFVDTGGAHIEINAGDIEQFTTTGRARGED